MNSIVSVRCVSSTTQEAPRRRGPTSSSPVRIAALTCNGDGALAAYAVRRSAVLPQEGSEDPAYCIRIARTRATGTRDALMQGGVEPFSDWLVVQVLAGVHTSPITALSWCIKTGALVSASADRCVYVWVPTENCAAEGGSTPRHDAGSLFQASPQLVMLGSDVLLSPMTAAWSAQGDKLYLGTAGGTVAVGRYDRHQQWWICRILLNAQVNVPGSQPNHNAAHHKDTTVDTRTQSHKNEQKEPALASPSPAPFMSHGNHVISLAPHPFDNTRVAVALLNGSVRILSTHINSLDGALSDSKVGPMVVDATEKHKEVSGEDAVLARNLFGYVYFSQSLSCWLHCLAWSPSGRQLAVVGHDSTLHVWQLAPRSSMPALAERPFDILPAHTALRLRVLPLLQCVFASEDRIVAAGFEGCVYVFDADTEERWFLAAEGKDEAGVSHPRSSSPCRSPSCSTATEKMDHPVGSAPITSSVRQRAFEFFQRSNATAAPTSIARASSSSKGTQTTTRHDGSATSQTSLRTGGTPLHLLLPLPTVIAASAAASSVQAVASRKTSTFLSASSNGYVQVWRVNTAV